MKAVPLGLAAVLLVLCLSFAQLRASDDEVICLKLVLAFISLFVSLN